MTCFDDWQVVTTRLRGQPSWERGQHYMRPKILASRPRWPRELTSNHSATSYTRRARWSTDLHDRSVATCSQCSAQVYAPAPTVTLSFGWQPTEDVRSFVLLPCGTVCLIQSKTLLCQCLVFRITLRHFSSLVTNRFRTRYINLHFTYLFIYLLTYLSWV